MTTKIETLIELKKEVNRTTSVLNAFINENKRDLLNDLAAEFKKIEGVNKIAVKGYTPGFNDGDPCTHDSTVYYNKRWHFSELAEYDVYGLHRFLGAPEEYEDSDELYEWEGINSINTYSDEDEAKVSELANLLDFLVEEMYGTDYIVYIDLTGDEPTVQHEDFYCGY